VADGTPTDNSMPIDAIMRLIDELRYKPGGIIIHDQLTRVLGDWFVARDGVDKAYSTLMNFFLASVPKNPGSDEIARIAARLIDARQQLGGSRSPIQVTAEYTTPPSSPETAEPETDSTTPREDPDALSRLREAMAEYRTERRVRERRSVPPPAPEETEPSGEPVGPGVDEPQVSAATEPAAPPGQEGPSVERRVNSAYRLHLDRKHGEIEKLQETLALKAQEAIAQNREFGALLEIERSALQQASSVDEIEDLKHILIGGTDELIAGQRALADKLQSSYDYLQLIRSDSQRMHEELNKVRLLSLTDEFTGLPNRRAFMRRLEDEIGRAQRYSAPLAMALIDLDKFKAVNDRYGHQAGDAVLSWYATRALPIFRHHDMVARYGGEEFAVLFPSTNTGGARRALEKVRARVEGAHCECEGNRISVPTFSAGLAMYREGELPESLISRADKALYRAKNLGRDRVEVEAAPEPKEGGDEEPEHPEKNGF
jgi:diguanylate cyclase